VASLTQAEVGTFSHDLHCVVAALQSVTSFAYSFMHLKFFRLCTHDMSVLEGVIERDHRIVIKALVIFLNSRCLTYSVFRHVTEYFTCSTKE
jgi:hypothetical protein